MGDDVGSGVELAATTPVEEEGRRGFLRKAFMTAAGMAFYTAVADHAQAQAAGNVPVHAGDVNVVFAEGKVSTSDLVRALQQILNVVGCSGCGLVGIDIDFLRGDPVQLEGGLPAVQGVLVTAR